MWGLKINKIKNTNNNVDIYQVSINRTEYDYTIFFSNEASVIEFIWKINNLEDVEKIIKNYNRKNKLMKIEQRR